LKSNFISLEQSDYLKRDISASDFDNFVGKYGWNDSDLIYKSLDELIYKAIDIENKAFVMVKVW